MTTAPDTPDDGGAAFPSEQGQTQECEWNQTYSQGMSLRDWFAGQAASGLLAALSTGTSAALIAKEAYTVADAMIAARKVTQ